jgi:hypothetical protein
MDHRPKSADWIVPAILAGVGLLLAVTVGIVLAVTSSPSEPDGLAAELEVYTRCLADHGADVPVVDARRDGGFSVTVPGALVDHGPDPEAWWSAHGECADVAPDLFGGLFGGLTGILMGDLGDMDLLDMVVGELLDRA